MSVTAQGTKLKPSQGHFDPYPLIVWEKSLFIGVSVYGTHAYARAARARAARVSAEGTTQTEGVGTCSSARVGICCE